MVGLVENSEFPNFLIVLFSLSSPSEYIFFICSFIVDLDFWNKSAICSCVNQTVSSTKVTSTFVTPSSVVYYNNSDSIPYTSNPEHLFFSCCHITRNNSIQLRRKFKAAPPVYIICIQSEEQLDSRANMSFYPQGIILLPFPSISLLLYQAPDWLLPY